MAAQGADYWDRWNGYYYFFGEDQRCVVTFNVAACDPKNQRPTAGRRLIGFTPDDYISPGGMPNAVAFERLKAIEARVTSLLAHERVQCWLVGKHVYLGMRELLFQVEEPHVQAFEAVCATIESEFGGTKVVPYEGWKFFNDKIAPNEDAQGHIANREILTALEKHGADLSKEHVLDHTFLGTEEALAAVTEELASSGYTGPGASDGHVVLSFAHSLDQDELDHLTQEMRRIASDHGAKYDGWGTMLAR